MSNSITMLGRNFKHTVRNPVAVFNAVLFPIVLMLMFVYVIGGAFDVGVKYIDYATPGMIVLAICYGLSAIALAFRPAASFPEWLGAIGLIVLVSFAASWLTVALGLAAKTPESAGMAVVPLIMLPFLSSAIVPVATMGAGVRQFAEYQPFTPIIESLRGLLAGAPSAGDVIAAIAWCAGIALVGYLWS